MTDSADVVALVTEAERDNKILALRLTGLSVRRLAKEFRVKDAEILAALDRALPPLSQETRVRLYREDLSRIDDLFAGFYPAARQGNATAAQVCIRLLERRSAMCGTDAPVRVDAVVAQAAADQPTSTEALLRELNRIAGERGSPLIEHEPSEPAPEPPPSA